MLADLKFAARSLLKTPGFTVVALLTLTLGIGVNTAMFGVVNTLLFRPGPYPEPDRLVRIFRTSPQSQTWPHSLPNFRDEQAQADVFSAAATFQWWTYSLAEPGQPAEQVTGVTASADLFATLGATPLLGRTFTREEQLPGRDRVAVLSYACWQQRFSGDPQIIGRTLRLDGETVTVVGVMPESFAYPLFWGRVDVWRPLKLLNDWREDRGNNWLHAIGRLKPGVSLAQAQAEMDAIAARLAREFPANNAGIGLRLVPLHQSAMDAVGRSVSWFTLGLAGVVLLIACANLANLQLARTAAGARDFAVRAALGASRARLMGQQLAESVVLSLAGGALGLLIAGWVNDAIGRQLTMGDASGLAFPLDLRVLGFALLASLATGVAFGTVPAWMTARIDINTALKQQSRGATGDRSQHQLRHGLIVAEVALALVLLSGAGFFIRGLQRFMQRDLGWDTTGLLTGTITLPENRYPTDESRRAFHEQLEERLTALPGVQHVALGSSLPTWSFGSSGGVFVEGRPMPPRGREPLIYYAVVNADYFATLRIPLIAGRFFPAHLRPDSPRVIVINETMARTLWPGEDPIGKRVSASADQPQWEEVIGVVRDVGFAANFGTPDTRLQAYRPLVFQPWGYVTIALRASAPGTLAEPLRRLVAGLDPDLPVAELRTVRQTMDRYQHNFHVVDEMLSGFALLGLLLAAVGLYGVISHLVVRRLPEFGIRVALGAPPESVLWLVLGTGLRLVALGSALGLAGAFAVLRLLGAVLPGIPGQDPLMLALAVLALAAVAALACVLPALRATRADPLVALRSE
ncbi:MAG TPA: ABC transporter permease [Opitutaceae bacterium]|nr:ABC transporter permease [Opitutaceae bacterium]